MRFEPAVEFLRLYNDLPAQQIGDGQVMIELGDLYSEEARKVLLKLKVPALAELGLARVATLELAYVELPGLVEQVVSLPITVNVVPGDEAAGRVAHPTVESEVLFQEAQDVKRQASEAFEHGMFDVGQRLIGETKQRLARSLEVAPEALKPEIQLELDDVARMERLGDVSGPMGAPMMSKMSRDSYHQMNRKRGRTRRDPDGRTDDVASRLFRTLGALCSHERDDQRVPGRRRIAAGLLPHRHGHPGPPARVPPPRGHRRARGHPRRAAPAPGLRLVASAGGGPRPGALRRPSRTPCAASGCRSRPTTPSSTRCGSSSTTRSSPCTA